MGTRGAGEGRGTGDVVRGSERQSRVRGCTIITKEIPEVKQQNNYEQMTIIIMGLHNKCIATTN